LAHDVRRDRWEGHDRGSPRRSDLGVTVRQLPYKLGVFCRPTDVWHAVPKLVSPDLPQGVGEEETWLDASVIRNKIELRPITGGFRKVPWMAAQRIRRSRCQTFVDADVIETRLAVLEPLVVFLDQLERWVGHILIVVAPLAHQAVWIVVDLCGVRDV